MALAAGVRLGSYEVVSAQTIGKLALATLCGIIQTFMA